jgi:hypothetical protein
MMVDFIHDGRLHGAYGADLATKVMRMVRLK